MLVIGRRKTSIESNRTGRAQEKFFIYFSTDISHKIAAFSADSYNKRRLPCSEAASSFKATKSQKSLKAF